MASPPFVLAAVFSPTGLIIWIIIGLTAGFLVNRIINVGGYSIVGDIVIGLIGAFIGGLLANLVIPDSNFGLIGSIIAAIMGACILIPISRATFYNNRSTKQRPSSVQKRSPQTQYVMPTPAPAQSINVSSTPPQHPAMPSVKPPFFVFVSHSSRDDAFGQMLVRDLRKELGGDEAVWYDSDGGLYGGDSWWSRIVSVVSMCDIFIIIISPDSMSSRWVMKEFEIAFTQNKIIVPVLYRQTQIRADIQTIQYISFLGGSNTYKTGLNKLLQAIRH